MSDIFAHSVIHTATVTAQRQLVSLDQRAAIPEFGIDSVFRRIRSRLRFPLKALLPKVFERELFRHFRSAGMCSRSTWLMRVCQPLPSRL